MGGIPSKEEMQKALIARHGEKLQEQISSASVAICGLGGLGSNVAIALARSGIGRLHLIDFDKVDISNLNRQQYKANQIGCYKTEALAEILHEIAPYTDIVIDNVKITEENAVNLLKHEDIICEAFDLAEAKAMLVNCTLENMAGKYIVSGSGMAGIYSSNTIKTRKVMDRFYICGDGVSDISDGIGLVAPRVMICAAHQANMIIRIIAGEYDV